MMLIFVDKVQLWLECGLKVLNILNISLKVSKKEVCHHLIDL